METFKYKDVYGDTMNKEYAVKKLKGRDLYECPYCGRAYKRQSEAFLCKLACEDMIHELNEGLKNEKGSRNQ